MTATVNIYGALTTGQVLCEPLYTAFTLVPALGRRKEYL